MNSKEMICVNRPRRFTMASPPARKAANTYPKKNDDAQNGQKQVEAIPECCDPNQSFDRFAKDHRCSFAFLKKLT